MYCLSDTPSANPFLFKVCVDWRGQAWIKMQHDRNAAVFMFGRQLCIIFLHTVTEYQWKVFEQKITPLNGRADSLFHFLFAGNSMLTIKYV